MITGLTGENLPQWIDTARTAGLPGITSFTKGLEQDLDAVTNGLTMPWSSGPVEGRVIYKDGQAPDVWPRRPAPAPRSLNYGGNVAGQEAFQRQRRTGAKSGKSSLAGPYRCDRGRALPKADMRC